MKGVIFYLVALMIISINVNAEGLYGGAGYDIAKNRGLAEHQNVHILIGQGFTDRLSVEGEINTTLFPSSGLKGSNSLSLSTVARSKGHTFLKAKFGYTLIDYYVEDTSGNVTTNKSNGITYGIGVGLELVNGDTLEFDYIVLPRKIDSLAQSDNTFTRITYKVRY